MIRNSTKKFYFRTALLYCFLFAVSAVAMAQKPPTVTQLSFMTGSWKLQHEWGDMTEIWSDTAGNNMMCTYRCVSEGKLIFYEFIVIEQGAAGPEMKLRHYGPGSIGWEDKDTPNVYPLTQLTASKAVFERPDKKVRLIYERLSPVKLLAVLEKQDEKGQWQKDEFRYTLAGK